LLAFCADSVTARATSSAALLAGLDHPYLALGALGDVTDGVGDLAGRSAGLLGGRGHLLGGSADAGRGCGNLGHGAPQASGHLLEGVTERVLLRAGVDVDREVTLRDLCRR
jgi:hypothetical protein